MGVAGILLDKDVVRPDRHFQPRTMRCASAGTDLSICGEFIVFSFVPGIKVPSKTVDNLIAVKWEECCVIQLEKIIFFETSFKRAHQNIGWF